MQTNLILDVREIEPQLKHPSIFSAFDQLQTGGILTLVNDHDPLPLYYQFRSIRPGIFDWEYVESGPVEWKINITKCEEEPVYTIAEMVTHNPKTAIVFKKYQIDYCCNGKKLFKEVCKELNLSPGKITKEIQELNEQPVASLRVQDWSLEMLCNYITNNHHTYVKKASEEIKILLDKVSRSHGEKHQELFEIRNTFKELCTELKHHIHKEEEVLFPAIKLMESGEQRGFHFGSVRNPVSMMEIEHDEAGEMLQYIRKVSNDFKVPVNACTSYKVVMHLLEEFEDDLHHHMHLENNILFPKAIALEKLLQTGIAI
jgi:regulator of cell morphogenesis and NO signaling